MKAPPRILIADDSAEIAAMLALFLSIGGDIEGGGYDVTVASSGEEALERYAFAKHEERPFRLLILDLAMPFTNGFEVEEKIRATGDTWTRVVFLSADTPALESRRAADLVSSGRASALWTKPILAPVFCAGVRAALEAKP